jgi:hypothetical protein
MYKSDKTKHSKKYIMKKNNCGYLLNYPRIRMDLKEIVWEHIDCIDLVGNFLTS